MGDMGRVYQRTSQWQHEKWQRLCALVSPHFDPASWLTALDLGCGTGQRTQELEALFPSFRRIIGIDSSASMLAIAEQDHRSEKVEYRHLSIENLQAVAGAVFDFVVANYSLHWVEDKEHLLSQLNKRTRLGSVLAVGTCAKLPSLLQTIDDFVKPIGASSSFHYLSFTEWTATLERFGWQVAGSISSHDPHLIEQTHDFLSQWFAASAGRAFYGQNPDELPQKQSLLSELNRLYHHPLGWEFAEDTLLFVAKRMSLT